MADHLVIDTRDIAKFIKQLRTSGLDDDKEMARQFGKAFRAGGEIVATIARGNASFSSRIPSTVKVRRSGAKVKVIAGGSSAPHAAPYEHNGVGGNFRHPVFGHDVWVPQKAHPFLRPALAEGGPRAIAALESELDRTYRKVWK